MMIRLSPSLIRLIAGPCLALAMAAALSACASTEETPYVERPVETIYSEAAAAMDQERFKEAALEIRALIDHGGPTARTSAAAAGGR